MALFTDGEINNLQDLQRIESALLDIANVEQIDLNAKMALAQDQIAGDLLIFLLKQTPRNPFNPILSYQAGSARRLLGVSDVVVTPPLKRWHALKSIEYAYEDAYNNQLNDRYQGKWKQYQQKSSIAAGQLYQIGVGLSSNPIPKAAVPLLLSTAGNLLAATYCVQVTWVNQTGQEGAPSDMLPLETVDESQLIVSVSGAPPNAVGWNVYAGLAPDAISLQNATPMAVQTSWTIPATGLILGVPVGNGQSPDYHNVNDRVTQRG